LVTTRRAVVCKATRYGGIPNSQLLGDAFSRSEGQRVAIISPDWILVREGARKMGLFKDLCLAILRAPHPTPPKNQSFMSIVSVLLVLGLAMRLGPNNDDYVDGREVRERVAHDRDNDCK